jgi:hypothetical protein
MMTFILARWRRDECHPTAFFIKLNYHVSNILQRRLAHEGGVESNSGLPMLAGAVTLTTGRVGGEGFPISTAVG